MQNIQEKKCAFTIVYGEKARKQARLLRKSFNSKHPDIPFFILDEDALPLLTGQNMPARICEVIGLRALAGFFFSHAFDRVIYFDSDIVVFDYLEALVESPHRVLLTEDRPEFEMGPEGAPKINSGVVMAQDSKFWLQWAEIIYGTAFPVFNWLGDQFALRMLAKQKASEIEILNETQRRECYNAIAYSWEGDYHIHDHQKVMRGNLEVKVYHWAGQSIRDFSIFPPEVEQHFRSGLIENREKEAQDTQQLKELLYEAGTPFFTQAVVPFIQNLPLRIIEDKWLNEIYAKSPGVMWSYAPLVMDNFRKLDEKNGLQRVSNSEIDQSARAAFYYYVDASKLLETQEVLSSLNQI